MKPKMTMLAGLFFIVSGGSFAANPSFDCSKAASKVEKLICSNKNLSEADGMLSEQYKDLQEINTDKTVKQRQINWIKTVRNACNDVACLQTAYDERSDELLRERANTMREQKIALVDTDQKYTSPPATKTGIPSDFQGVWSDDKEACTQLTKGLNTDKIVTIKADQIIGYESKCKFQSGDIKASGFDGKFSCEDDGGRYQSSYSLAMTAQRQLLLSVTIKGKRSPTSQMVSCGGGNPASKRRTESAKNIVANKANQTPLVQCSSGDQIGLVDPKTGSMSQKALDIQMGKVRCR